MKSPVGKWNMGSEHVSEQPQSKHGTNGAAKRTQRKSARPSIHVIKVHTFGDWAASLCVCVCAYAPPYAAWTLWSRTLASGWSVSQYRRTNERTNERVSVNVNEKEWRTAASSAERGRVALRRFTVQWMFVVKPRYYLHSYRRASIALSWRISPPQARLLMRQLCTARPFALPPWLSCPHSFACAISVTQSLCTCAFYGSYFYSVFAWSHLLHLVSILYILCDWRVALLCTSFNRLLPFPAEMLQQTQIRVLLPFANHSSLFV